jgi:DNA-binding NarL/FixJ family response regulator
VLQFTIVASREGFARRKNVPLKGNLKVMLLASRSSQHFEVEGRPLITNESELTALEMNVLRDLAYGLATSQIAEKRSLSPTLSEDCVNGVYVKLGASSRQNLIVKAFVRGFIDEAAFDAAFTASVAHVEHRPTSCFP